MSERPTTLFDFLKTLSVIGGGLAMLVGGGNWIYKMTDLLATKAYVVEYNDEQMAPVVESLGNIEQSAVVTRIRGLLDAKCVSPNTWSPELQNVLDTQMQRYLKLTGRQFGATNWCSRMEVGQ